MRSFASVSIDVTYLCNMKCRHCYNKSNRVDPREMSRETLLGVSADVAGLWVESVCLCGGEPLCRINDVVEMAAMIKAIDPSKAISLVTNGLLWKEDTGSILREAGIIAVQFSLDGFSDDSYDFVRNSGGELNKVFRAVDIAIDAGLRVMICTLPHKKSYPEIDDIIKFCAEKKVEEFRVQPLMPLGRGEEAFYDLVLSQQEYSVLRKKLKDADAFYPHIKVEWGDPIDHFFMMLELGGIPNIAINAYGEVLLSPYLPITIWNLNKHSIAEYVSKNIDIKALQLPYVRNALSRMMTVSDMTSKIDGMPELFLDKNIDLSDKLARMEVAS